MQFQRKTLAAAARFEGVGLHGGEPVSVVVHPSEEGIRFRFGEQSYEAIPENVTETRRCTRIGPVATVEHLMSALAGLEVTDAEIEVTAPELPALDGCAAAYVSGLRAAGFSSLGTAELAAPFSRVFVQDENCKLAVAAGTGHWRYVFESRERWPFYQEFEAEDIVAEYPEGIAVARTFGFEDELPTIQEQGLAKGLDLSTALLLGSNGYVNEPKFDNEPARHKLLDAMGDLYLAGLPLRFLSVVAERTGHTANVKAASLLRQAMLGE